MGPPTIEGHVREVIDILTEVDVTAAMIAITLSSWESEHEERHGDDGWGYGPGLFLLYRNFPPDEVAEALARQHLIGQGTRMQAVGLPDEVNTLEGPTMPMVLHAIADAMRRDQDILRSMVQAEDAPWELCAAASVVEGVNEDNQAARITTAVDRARYRYYLIRQRGDTDDERELQVQFDVVDRDDDVQELADALSEMIDAVPEEDMPE